MAFRKTLILLFFILIVSVLIDAPQHLSGGILESKKDSQKNTKSLLPEIERIVGVRFDPSFHYNTNKMPSELAKELAETLKKNNVNHIFYRVYDPEYGAFYRTKYKYNIEGEFGKYNLLKYVIRECHKNGIKVFAWLPMLNHGGAWKENPAWREKMKNGADYIAVGFRYPLCPRVAAVREWWFGFIDDILKNYPGLDGVDFVEPIISWKDSDACFCAECEKARKTELKDFGSTVTLRSYPMTTLLSEGIKLARKAGKQACITTIVPSHKDGNIYTFAEIENAVGLNLPAVIRASKDAAPDFICPEFLWQEWRYNYKKNLGAGGQKSRREIAVEKTEIDETFSPEWTMNSIREFKSRLEDYVPVIAHLEITDFTGVNVSEADLRKSIVSAIDGGANGIDVYSAFLLENKKAWSAFASASQVVKKKACLVIHDKTGYGEGVQVGELLRHFNTSVALLSADQYTTGAMNKYDAVFYVGTESGSNLTETFLTDAFNYKGVFCWLGFNIERLLGDEGRSNTLGLEFVSLAKDQFASVEYKGMTLEKKDPYATIINPFAEHGCDVLSTMSGGGNTAPYALRCRRNFWYFADVPPSFAVEGDKYLVFSDLLHDILEENHKTKHLAMVRIEDTNPMTDPDAIRRIADFLSGENIPFQIGITPIYVYPDNNMYVPMSEKPEYVSAIKYAVKKGATVVMHGTTHQRYGETTADYEFWDPLSDTPPQNETEQTIKDKLEKGLLEFWGNGIYPLMWETPHYAGSQLLYKTVSKYFSISMERRQAIDKTGWDQYLPYMIFDRFGQYIIPENLGYIPLENQNSDVVVAPALKTKVVRDGVASFFFHTFIDISVLKDIVKKMKRGDLAFTDISDLPIKVAGATGHLTSCENEVSLTASAPLIEEKILKFPGVEEKKTESQAAVGTVITKKFTLKDDELCFIRAHHLAAAHGEGEGGAAGAVKSAKKLLHSISNQAGEQCRAVSAAVVVNPEATGEDLYEQESLKNIMRVCGIDFEEINIGEFYNISPLINLAVISNSAGEVLSEAQANYLVGAVKDRGLYLIFSGRNVLSDSVNIDVTSDTLELTQIKDDFYPDIRLSVKEPIIVPIFEAPSDVSYVYVDKKTENPLMVSGTLGAGRYIYLGNIGGLKESDSVYFEQNPHAVVPMEKNLWAERYPYLLTHIFRILNIYPPVQRNDLEIYFNPGERGEDISVEDLIKFWKRSGVRRIYAGAWHVFENWTYDYSRLIELAHSNAMLVYAYFEPPYVNEKFWLSRPEWRVQNVFGKDIVYGLKPMALSNPKCLDAAKMEYDRMLKQYDWDGILVRTSGWDNPGFLADAENYMPFDKYSSDEFVNNYGFESKDLFDPSSIHYWMYSLQSLACFEEFKAESAKKWLDSLLSDFSSRKLRGNIGEIILTSHKDKIYNSLLWKDFADLKQKYSLTLQNSAAVSGEWIASPDEADMVEIRLAPSADNNLFFEDAPTKYPTGLHLYFLLHDIIGQKKRFSLFSENAVYEIDRFMLPLITASEAVEQVSAESIVVETTKNVALSFAGEKNKNVMLNDKIAPTFYRNNLTIPHGSYRISQESFKDSSMNQALATSRIIDCSAEILGCEIGKRGLSVLYDSPKNAAFILISEEPRKIVVDVKITDGKPKIIKGILGWSIELPQGRHNVRIITRSYFDLLLLMASLSLSNIIIILSSIAILGLAAIFIRSKLKTRV